MAGDKAAEVKETLTEEQAKELVQYDLSMKMVPFLDTHLLVAVFNFLQDAGVYKTESIKSALLKLICQTNMIDWAIDLHPEDKPEELEQRREVVLEQLEGSRNKVLPMLELLEENDKFQLISQCKTIEEICSTFEFDIGVIDELYTYGKLQYDCGNYTLSGMLLQHYRSIMSQDSERPITSKQVSATWGRLAASILSQELDELANGAEVVFKINEHLETAKMSKKEVLLNRTWLLHWTLFLAFHPIRQGTLNTVEVKLLDFLFNDKSLSCISLACPYLFRYVSACLILQKRLKHLTKDTVWIIQHEASVYSDPITRFLLALYVEMDFDEAQKELQQCEKVIKVDYFLHKHWAEFQENARLLIFETYCRIHQCINIGMIASKLNMEAEEAEVWIVKLIQSAKLDARIDSEKSRVVMSKAPPSVYQQVIEKTKNLSFRSTMLLSNLEKRDKELKSAS